MEVLPEKLPPDLKEVRVQETDLDVLRFPLKNQMSLMSIKNKQKIDIYDKKSTTLN